MIKSIFYNFIFSFFLLFIVVSCQEEDDSFFRSNNYNVVYGFRLTQQIRSGLLNVNNMGSNFDSASTALLARSSAFIYSFSLVNEPGSSDCKNPYFLIKNGSGNLTSPSTITTSMHGILFDSTDKCSFGVSFETNLSRAKYSGLYDRLKQYSETINNPIADGPSNADLFSGEFTTDFHINWKDGDETDPREPDYEGVNDYLRSSIVEENPLLANRLYALGLESWSHKSQKEIRTHLRSGWLFKRGLGNTQESVSPEMTQVTLTKDVGFLYACPLSDWTFVDTLPSGLFTLNQPGIFFDYLNTSVLIDESLRKLIEQKSPIFALYTQYHPVSERNFSNTSTTIDNNDASFVPLIAGPRGIFLKTLKVAYAQDIICKNNIQLNVSIKDGPVIATNIDGIKGSSGGNVVVKNFGENDVFDGSFTSFGLISKVDIPDSDPNKNGQLNSWGPGIPMERNSDDYSPPKSDPDPSKDYSRYATYVSLFNLDDKFYSKIHTYQPDPKVLVPVMESGELQLPISYCKKVDEKSHQCLEYGGSLEGNNLGNPPENLPTLFSNPVYSGDGFFENLSAYTEPFRTVSGSSPSIEPTDTTQYRLTCDSWLFKHNKSEVVGVGPGVAIGLVGSTSVLHEYPYLSYNYGRNIVKTPLLGSFRLICSPWSSAPFVYNWDLLFWMGRKVNPDHDQIFSFNDNWIDSLSRGLTTSFSKRQISTLDTARPIAMKTCPPNYLLQGFNVIYNQNPQYVIGIESLICVSTHAKAKNLTVCLNPSRIGSSRTECQTSDLDWSDEANFYTLNGVPFSLSQDIGQNNFDFPNSHPDPIIEPIRCKNSDEIVNNIFIEGKSHEVVTKINIGCILRPYSLRD